MKDLATAKSRLDHPDRRALAIAFVRDVIDACQRTPTVVDTLVVTDDAAVLDAIPGVRAVRSALSLNDALVSSSEAVRTGDRDAHVAALVGDLPALHPDELSAALMAASGHARSFVSDIAGTGTTLLCASAPHPLAPAFGYRSRAAHRSSGAVEIDDAGLSGLRCDVDTAVDLWYASTLGTGRNTDLLLGRLETEHDTPATVRDFDASSRDGSVLLDDGTILTFTGAAFDVGGLRLLRPGQRVRVRRLHGQVTGVTLATFAWADRPYAS